MEPITEQDLRTRWTRVKDHFREKKGYYITGSVCFVIGAATVVVTGRKFEGVENVNLPIFSPRSNIIQTTIELVERSTPSKPVHLVGTNLYFDSLSDASRKTGHIDHVGGDVFELLETA